MLIGCVNTSWFSHDAAHFAFIHSVFHNIGNMITCRYNGGRETGRCSPQGTSTALPPKCPRVGPLGLQLLYSGTNGLQRDAVLLGDFDLLLGLGLGLGLLYLKYHKVPKFLDAKKLCCNLTKIQTKRPNLGYFVKIMQME